MRFDEEGPSEFSSRIFLVMAGEGGKGGIVHPDIMNWQFNYADGFGCSAEEEKYCCSYVLPVSWITQNTYHAL